jgi:TolB-like protein/tetratricopeptide (TPR) repeat protein
MGKGLLRELRRRHVYRVGVAYAVVGWLLIEVTTQIFPVFHMPDWAAQLVVLLIVLGFPVALVLAWALEVTPEGVRRTEPADSPEARAPEQRRRVGRMLDMGIITVLAIVVAVLAGLRWWPRGPSPKMAQGVTHARPALPVAASAPASADVARAATASTAIPAKSIAVLPFENLSPDKDNAYFADGMQDLILTRLAGIGGLKVISRTSTMQYGSHPQDLKRIGRNLGVASVLEGSVQKAGDQVLINVQLIDARTDAHIWAESYQRTLKNVFGVEGEVAQKVAGALSAKLSPRETRQLATGMSSNPQAVTLYLKARYQQDQQYMGDGNREHRSKAMAYASKAIALDPGFASARVLLAGAQFELSQNKSKDNAKESAKWLAMAQSNLDRALRLAPDLGRAHGLLGAIFLSEGQTQKGVAELHKALRLAPNDAEIRIGLALQSAGTGHWAEALAQAQRAVALDPSNSSYGHKWLAQIEMGLRRYPEAIVQARQALALNPKDTGARMVMVRVYFLSGNTAAVRKEAKGFEPAKGVLFESLLLERDYPSALALARSMPKAERYKQAGYRDMCLGRVLHDMGRDAEAGPRLDRARKKIEAVVRKHPDNIELQYRLAWIETMLGHRAAALARVRRQMAKPVPTMPGARLDRLHSPVEEAEILGFFGRAREATALLRQQLATPGTGLIISPALLRLDPDWDPIRRSPEFQALLDDFPINKPIPVRGTYG